MLTAKQKALLLLIDRRIKEGGVPPSYDEMKTELGLASKSGIHRLITALEERGFIRRLPNKARAIEVLKVPSEAPARAKAANASLPQPAPQPANDTVELPFVGKIAAGSPIAAIEGADLIPVPNHLVGRGDHFALEVEGESMKDAGILDGDIVICRRADTARNNQIVVALVDQDEATLKTLRRSGSQIELVPENEDFEVQVYGPDRVEVQGILVGLLRTYH